MSNPTPPLEELRIILEGMSFLNDMEPDHEHPNPREEALEMIPDALDALTAYEKKLTA